MTDALEDLWWQAIMVGDLTVQSRVDERGQYVDVWCMRPNGVELICSASTVTRALRTIIDWTNRGRFAIEVYVDKCWMLVGYREFLNEIAAEKAVFDYKARYGPHVRFVVVGQ